MQSFEEIVEIIRNSSEQVASQAKARKYHYFSCFLFILFLVFLLFTILIAFSSEISKSIYFLLIPIDILTLFYSEKYFVNSIKLAKEQDRKFFLECLRQSKSIDDLNKAGLFAHFESSYGKEWIQDVNKSITQLKSSLSITPDWLKKD